MEEATMSRGHQQHHHLKLKRGRQKPQNVAFLNCGGQEGKGKLVGRAVPKEQASQERCKAVNGARRDGQEPILKHALR